MSLILFLTNHQTDVNHQRLSMKKLYVNVVVIFLTLLSILSYCNLELAIVWNHETFIKLIHNNCRRAEWHPPFRINLKPYICVDDESLAGSPILDQQSEEKNQDKQPPTQNVGDAVDDKTLSLDSSSSSPSKQPSPPSHSFDKLPIGDQQPSPSSHPSPETDSDPIRAESMPSFTEWKIKRISESGDEATGQDTLNMKGSAGFPANNGRLNGIKGVKGGAGTVPSNSAVTKRVRNYASNECGSKVIASNPEAEGTSKILSETKDEYMLNPCRAKIWFVVELCESLQPSSIEIANLELFSSTPKDLAIYGSPNYPTREWFPLGSFSASDVRSVQRFQLQTQPEFLKFMKIEMLSNHGEQHFCPLSLLRVYGTSIYDAIEDSDVDDKKFDNGDDVQIDEDQNGLFENSIGWEKSSNSLLGSAREAVINIVKQAAIVLGTKSPNQETNVYNDTNSLETEVIHMPLAVIPLVPALDSHLKNCECSFNVVKTAQSEAVSSSSLAKEAKLFFDTQQKTPNDRLPKCEFFRHLLGSIYSRVCKESKKESSMRFMCKIVTNHPMNGGVDGRGDSVPHFPIKLNDLINNDSLLPSYHITASSNIHSLNTPFPVDGTVNSGITLSHQTTDFVFDSTATVITPLHQASTTVSSQSSESILPLLVDTLHTSAVPTMAPDSLSPDSAAYLVPNHASTVFQLNGTIIAAAEEQVEHRGVNHATTAPGPSSSNSAAANGQPNSGSLIVNAPNNAGSPVTPPKPTSAGQTQQAQQPVINNGTLSATENWGPSVGSTGGQAREAIFIRMSQKIRALEVNLSLSSQYLEELSQRYRLNLEEMQRAFNRTIAKLNETARVAAEKDDIQQEMLEDLSQKLLSVKETVSLLVAEKQTLHWQFIQVHILLLVIEIIIMIYILSYFMRRQIKKLNDS